MIRIVFLFFRLFTLHSRSRGTFDVLLPYCVSLRLLGGSASVFSTHKARAIVIFDKPPPPPSADMLMLCRTYNRSGRGVEWPSGSELPRAKSCLLLGDLDQVGHGRHPVSHPTPRTMRRSLRYPPGFMATGNSVLVQLASRWAAWVWALQHTPGVASAGMLRTCRGADPAPPDVNSYSLNNICFITWLNSASYYCMTTASSWPAAPTGRAL